MLIQKIKNYSTDCFNKIIPNKNDSTICKITKLLVLFIFFPFSTICYGLYQGYKYLKNKNIKVEEPPKSLYQKTLDKLNHISKCINSAFSSLLFTLPAIHRQITVNSSLP